MTWKGISAHVLARAGVTMHNGLVRIPYRDPAGAVVYDKVVAPSRSWYDPAGIHLIPFGLETLNVADGLARHCGVFVTEGESDCLALREAFAISELEDVALWLAIALPGAGTWKPSWRPYLEPFDLIYVIGDGDGPGRAMNSKLKRDLPQARPVWLPDGEDVRSILQRQGPAAFEQYLDDADEDARLSAVFATTNPSIATGEEVAR